MNTPPRFVVKRPGEGRTLAVVGDVYRFLATGEDTNGKYALWHAIVPPGGGPPPHVHSREEEGFLVLEGEISFCIGEERLVAGAGMFANIPVGTPHSFKNESDKPARMLIWVAPAGLEQMFFEVSVPLPPGATTAAPPTKKEIKKLLAGAPRYGVEIKLPVGDGDEKAGYLRTELSDNAQACCLGQSHLDPLPAPGPRDSCSVSFLALPQAI